MAATKSLFAPLPAPPVGAHRRNMSVQRRFPLLHRVCKCARKIDVFFFFLVKRWSLQTELSVSKKGRSTSNTQHSVFLHSLLLEPAQIARFPRVHPCWNDGGLIRVRRFHVCVSTRPKQMWKKKGRKWQNDSKYMYMRPALWRQINYLYSSRLR